MSNLITVVAPKQSYDHNDRRDYKANWNQIQLPNFSTEI